MASRQNDRCVSLSCFLLFLFSIAVLILWLKFTDPFAEYYATQCNFESYYSGAVMIISTYCASCSPPAANLTSCSSIDLQWNQADFNGCYQNSSSSPDCPLFSGSIFCASGPCCVTGCTSVCSVCYGGCDSDGERCDSDCRDQCCASGCVGSSYPANTCSISAALHRQTIIKGNFEDVDGDYHSFVWIYDISVDDRSAAAIGSQFPANTARECYYDRRTVDTLPERRESDGNLEETRRGIRFSIVYDAGILAAAVVISCVIFIMLMTLSITTVWNNEKAVFFISYLWLGVFIPLAVLLPVFMSKYLTKSQKSIVLPIMIAWVAAPPCCFAMVKLRSSLLSKWGKEWRGCWQYLNARIRACCSCERRRRTKKVSNEPTIAQLYEKASVVNMSSKTHHNLLNITAITPEAAPTAPAPV
jgi:hypothetical protein